MHKRAVAVSATSRHVGDEGVVVAVGSEKERGRITLDLEWVPKPGAETGVAAEFDRIQEPFRRDV